MTSNLQSDPNICGEDGPITAEQCALWLDAKYRRHGELEDRAAAMWLRKLSARSVPETTCSLPHDHFGACETPAKPSMIKLLDQVRERYREVNPGQCRILSNDDCRCFLCLTDSAMVLASQAERGAVKTTPNTSTGE